MSSGSGPAVTVKRLVAVTIPVGIGLIFGFDLGFQIAGQDPIFDFGLTGYLLGAVLMVASVFLLALSLNTDTKGGEEVCR